MFPETVLWAEAAPAQTTAASLGGMMPLVLIFVIFYFLLIRPQQKQVKIHQEMLASLKKGDTVVTSGGMIGTIVEMKNNELTLKIADNVRAKFTKSSVTALVKNDNQ